MPTIESILKYHLIITTTKYFEVSKRRLKYLMYNFHSKALKIHQKKNIAYNSKQFN